MATYTSRQMRHARKLAIKHEVAENPYEGFNRFAFRASWIFASIFGQVLYFVATANVKMVYSEAWQADVADINAWQRLLFWTSLIGIPVAIGFTLRAVWLADPDPCGGLYGARSFMDGWDAIVEQAALLRYR